jgi:hypothetical protein
MGLLGVWMSIGILNQPPLLINLRISKNNFGLEPSLGINFLARMKLRLNNSHSWKPEFIHSFIHYLLKDCGPLHGGLRGGKEGGEWGGHKSYTVWMLEKGRWGFAGF